MVIEATFFNKTKLVRAEPYNMAEDEEPDEVLWVERGEDYYALSSDKYNGKRVAIVKREDWLRARSIEDA